MRRSSVIFRRRCASVCARPRAWRIGSTCDTSGCLALGPPSQGTAHLGRLFSSDRSQTYWSVVEAARRRGKPAGGERPACRGKAGRWRRPAARVDLPLAGWTWRAAGDNRTQRATGQRHLDRAGTLAGSAGGKHDLALRSAADRTHHQCAGAFRLQGWPIYRRPDLRDCAASRTPGPAGGTHGCCRSALQARDMRVPLLSQTRAHPVTAPVPALWSSGSSCGGRDRFCHRSHAASE